MSNLSAERITNNCSKCDGWGCRACIAPAGVGEQGLSADELELVRLRGRVAQLEAENGRLRMQLEIADREARR